MFRIRLKGRFRDMAQVRVKFRVMVKLMVSLDL